MNSVNLPSTLSTLVAGRDPLDNRVSTSAGGVAAAWPAIRQAGGGASPTSALQCLRVQPIPMREVKKVLVKEHYLDSMPNGTMLAFGVFLGNSLLGAITLGAGSTVNFASTLSTQL